MPLMRTLFLLFVFFLDFLAKGAVAQTQGAGAAPGAPTMRVVGGLAGVSQYTRLEEPFWSHEVERLSGGKYRASIVPFDRAGLPGADMLRFLQLGVVPFGTVLMSSFGARFPQYAAADLAGLNPDMQTLRAHVAAFRPYLEKAMRAEQGIEVLAMYVYPAQMLFCKKPIATLADLRGWRVRVSSVAQADFVEALGAEPVHTAFAQLATRFQAGALDCAITGTMSGNTIGLADFTTHLYAMPLTWGMAIFGANQAAWQALPADLRLLLRTELPKLEAAVWAESERDTVQGLECNSGKPGCVAGRPGKMRIVEPTEADKQRSRAIFSATVLPRWQSRCGTECEQVWSSTIGRLFAPPARMP